MIVLSSPSSDPPPPPSPPRRSCAILDMPGRPSNSRIRWHPLPHPWLFSGVASYLQSPGRVSCEWGRTSVISLDSSVHRRAPPPSSFSGGETVRWCDARPVRANPPREERRCPNDRSLCDGPVVRVPSSLVLPSPPPSSLGGTSSGTMATVCMAASRKQGRPGRLLPRAAGLLILFRSR